MTADEFNALFPVGTPCTYFPIAGEDQHIGTRTRTPAWTLGHGAVVVSIERLAGCVLIEHLTMQPPESASPCACAHCDSQAVNADAAIACGWSRGWKGWMCARCNHRGDNDMPPCIGEAMRDTTLGIQRRAAHHKDMTP